MTPVFFENFAPPKKDKKKNLASKKRYLSQPKEKPVNLLISILHSHEADKKKKKKDNDNIFGKKKKSTSSKKFGLSLGL